MIRGFRRVREKLGIILSCAFLVVVAFTIGFQTGVFSGFPKGQDALGHASLVKIIHDNFPHVLWNPYWGGGEVLFPNFPPFYYFLLAGLSKVGGIWGIREIGGWMVWMAAANVILTAIFIFGLLYLLTRKNLPALIGALFYLASPTTWSQLLVDGFYSFTLAQTTLSLALLALIFYLKRLGKNDGGWPYHLVVFAFVAVAISHFLAAGVLVLAFLAFLLFLLPNFDDRIVCAIKILTPVLGLTAFFYPPLLSLGFLETGFPGVSSGDQSAPWSLSQLFHQTYPGLPFLSLPLLAFLVILVFFTRYSLGRKEKMTEGVFWACGFLTIFILLDVLGFPGFHWFGILPAQLLSLAVLFLAVFFGCGFYLLRSMKIVDARFLFVTAVGFFTLSFSQIPNWKREMVDSSQLWSEFSLKMPERKDSFRFAHHNKSLGKAFNFYSSSFQVGGGEGWFETAVFEQDNNSGDTTFLLDWYGVSDFYTGKLTRNGKPFSLEQKFQRDSGNFTQVGKTDWVYNNASSILAATNAPVVLVKTSEETYREILKVLAEKGIDSRRVIPLRVKEVGEKELPRVSSWEEMEKILGEIGEIGGIRGGEQKAKFINSQRREIELNGKFKGVLLKESYFRNWQAYLQKTEDGRQKTVNLKIYQAGPGMMYVFLPPIESGSKVVFEYRQSLIEKIGILISLVTLIVILFLGKLVKLVKLVPTSPRQLAGLRGVNKLGR